MQSHEENAQFLMINHNKSPMAANKSARIHRVTEYLVLFTAIFLAFYCPKKMYPGLKAMINLMAGIPSVVYGFFGLVWIVPMMRQITGKDGSTLLTASILLGIMILPTVVGVVEPALRSVPVHYYEGALALGEVIDDIRDEIKKRHVDRLRKGKCTIELGFILSDLMTSYKRIADHCSNISVCLIQAENDEFGRHAYLNSLRGEENKQFQKKFRNYAGKYALPDRKKIKE